MEQKCRDCRWSVIYADDDVPEDILYDCTWPSKFLPYSLRYGSSERTGVYHDDPPENEPCLHWMKKESPNSD